MLLNCIKSSTIYDIHAFQILILVYNFFTIKNKLPTIFKSYFNINNSLYHQNTYGRNSLHIDSCNTTIGIKYKGLKLWNKLPSHLKYCNSTNSSPVSSKYIYVRKLLIKHTLLIWHFLLHCTAELIVFVFHFVFLSRVSILTRDIDIANLSVRPSVRPLRSGTRWKRLNISS